MLRAMCFVVNEHGLFRTGMQTCICACSMAPKHKMGNMISQKQVRSLSVGRRDGVTHQSMSLKNVALIDFDLPQLY